MVDFDITVEYTVTENAAFYRFTYPKDSKSSNILISTKDNSEIRINKNNYIEGSPKETGNRKKYFYATFNKPFETSGTWENNIISTDNHKISGKDIGGFVTYENETIELKVALSTKSIADARNILSDELPDWNFDRAKENARNIWNRKLNRIKITGGTKSQRTIFYTSLYRTMWRKANVWDTYRCTYPLQTIIEPEVNQEVIRGFIKQYEKSGWFPSSGTMIGNHTTPVVLDPYIKGLRDFDVEKVYEESYGGNYDSLERWRTTDRIRRSLF